MGEKKIKIIGLLNNVTEQGLLVPSDDKLENIIKHWPQFLIFLKIRKDLFDESLPALLFSKSGKKIEVGDIDVDAALVSYLKYYSLCLSHISPMINKWAVPLLTKEENEFSAAVKRSFTEKKIFEDEYFKWAFSRYGNNYPSATIYRNWKKIVGHTFGVLAEIRSGK